MSSGLKILHPVFVHRVWECAGTDLLGVFDFEGNAKDFARMLIERGREPEKTCLVVCNTYTGEMERVRVIKEDAER